MRAYFHFMVYGNDDDDNNSKHTNPIRWQSNENTNCAYPFILNIWYLVFGTFMLHLVHIFLFCHFKTEWMRRAASRKQIISAFCVARGVKKPKSNNNVNILGGNIRILGVNVVVTYYSLFNIQSIYVLVHYKMANVECLSVT